MVEMSNNEHVSPKNSVAILGNSGMSIVSKWVVKYDDVFDMPQYIQGVYLGPLLGEAGKNIYIGDIESIDFEQMIVTRYTGDQCKLIGKGKRMILLNEEDVQNLANLNLEDLDLDE